MKNKRTGSSLDQYLFGESPMIPITERQPKRYRTQLLLRKIEAEIRRCFDEFRSEDMPASSYNQALLKGQLSALRWVKLQIQELED